MSYKSCVSGKVHKKRDRFRRRHGGRHYRRRGPRTKPPLSGLERAERSYINILERYLSARRKYFDLFHRANREQLAKLERVFSRAAEELRQFENGINPQILEKFAPIRSGLRRDTTYSENRGISSEVTEVEGVGENVDGDQQYPDPHLLSIQREADYSEDTLESQGTMEDYLAYKDGS